MADVVWWSKSGSVLHRRPQCPAFRRSVAAEYNAMVNAKATGRTKGIGNVQSYDFAEDIMSAASDYPPEGWPLCQLCGGNQP
jgi:hypothetical protein